MEQLYAYTRSEGEANAAANEAASSITTMDASQARQAAPAMRMFGDLDAAVRMRMELLARASKTADSALPYVIALIVDGEEKQQAIISAITTSDPLREQWERTWEILRR